MGRHGYSDDLDQQDLAMWRGQVMSSIRGRRGQKLLHDLRDALDAMPEKRLITGALVRDGEVCAIARVAQVRGVDMTGWENTDDDDGGEDDHDFLAKSLDVSACLVQEIEWANDEGMYSGTPEQRWEYMRKWVEKNITK